MKLREIMTRFPLTVAPSDTLIAARDRMLWGGVRHLPVVDGGDGRHRVVGVLSDGDIARHQARTGESLFSSPGDTVEMAMTTPVQTASADESVIEAMARVGPAKIGCLPITELGELVGLVTVTDLLSAEVRAHTENGGEASGPSIAEVMTPDPQIVRADDHLMDAAARMQQEHIRHLPVIDDEGRILGMLSDRDVRGAIGDPSAPHEEIVRDIRVSAAMSSPALTVKPTQSLTEVARMFAGLGSGAFPVVDDDLRVVGIISYVDALIALVG